MQRTLIYTAILLSLLVAIILGCENGKKDQIVALQNPEDKILNSKNKESKNYEELISNKYEKQQLRNGNTNSKEEKEYEIQLMASTDLEKLLLEKEKLEKKGYLVKISKKIIADKTYYRLRLAEYFTLLEAKNIAKTLKSEFNQIQEIWIQKSI